ncbi:MAG: PIN domain-containing protein [Methylococcaceae bacterium]
MKTNKPFFDTNVLLYLLSEDACKANRAEAIVVNGGIISVQVLNEFASVASRKLKMSYAEIHDVLRTVRAVCQVKSITVETHELGLNIAERLGFSLYDSLIISSALQSGCTVLYSEDMQNGQKIDGQLVILNPFLD